MNVNYVIKILKNIGYTDNEAQVFLATMESKGAPASSIARLAGLNRVTTYCILGQLMERGVVSSFEIGKVKHFSALDPELFIEDVQNKAHALEEALPFLQKLTGSVQYKPSVQFFEGVKGIKLAYKETLRATSDILNYANSQNLRAHWPEYDEEYVAERVKKRIFLKGIAPDDASGRRVQAGDKKFYRKTQLIPKEEFLIENEINIFDDKVVIASFEPDPFAIIIQSPAVAETQKQIFLMSWKG